MNDVIYGIFDGEYSDWQCIGYFENEEDAYRYCVETAKEYYDPYCFSSNGEICWTTFNESSLRAKPATFDPRPDRTLMTFMTLKLDKNLAEKIVYDLFAKWKNEKELRDKE